MNTSVIVIIAIILGLVVLSIGMFRSTEDNKKEDVEKDISQEESLFLLHKKATGHLKSIDRTLKFFFWLTVLLIVVSAIYWIFTPSAPEYY